MEQTRSSFLVFLLFHFFMTNTNAQNLCLLGSTGNTFINGQYIRATGTNNGYTYYTKATQCSTITGGTLYLYYQSSNWYVAESLNAGTQWARCVSSTDPTTTGTCINKWEHGGGIDTNIAVTYGTCDWNCGIVTTGLPSGALCGVDFTEKIGPNQWKGWNALWLENAYLYYHPYYDDFICSGEDYPPEVDNCVGYTYADRITSPTGWFNLNTGQSQGVTFEIEGATTITCLTTYAPTPAPTTNPIPAPTDNPTPAPTNNPTPAPTSDPTTAAPTTTIPSSHPSKPPTNMPSKTPSKTPSNAPTQVTPIPTSTTNSPTIITPAPSTGIIIETPTETTRNDEHVVPDATTTMFDNDGAGLGNDNENSFVDSIGFIILLILIGLLLCLICLAIATIIIRKKRMNDELTNSNKKSIEMMNRNAINYGNVSGNASPSVNMQPNGTYTGAPQRVNSGSHITPVGPIHSGATPMGPNVIDDNVTHVAITHGNTAMTVPGTAGYNEDIPSLPDDANIINTGNNNDDIFGEADGGSNSENEENDRELYFHGNTSGGLQNNNNNQQTTLR